MSILTLIVTAVLAYYAFRQWQAVDRTLNEIKAQTPAVEQSANAAVLSAQTAKEVAESSDKTTAAVLKEMQKQSSAQVKSADAASLATNTAVRELDLAQSPSLVILDTQLPGGIGLGAGYGIGYSPAVSVINKGRSNATDTALLSDLILETSGNSFAPKALIYNTCHKLDKVSPLSGELVPPGEKHLLDFAKFADGKPLRRLVSKAFIEPVSQRRIVTALMAVCVVYHSPISPAVHHTALLYDVSMAFSPEEASQIEQGTIPISRPVSVDGNHLTLHQFGVINGLVD